jgi:hypothetical protein
MVWELFNFIELNYKKGGGKFQQEQKSKDKMKKKQSKTGRKANQFKHKTKKLYDPSQKKRSSHEEKQTRNHKKG